MWTHWGATLTCLAADLQLVFPDFSSSCVVRLNATVGDLLPLVIGFRMKELKWLPKQE